MKVSGASSGSSSSSSSAPFDGATFEDTLSGFWEAIDETRKGNLSDCNMNAVIQSMRTTYEYLKDHLPLATDTSAAANLARQMWSDLNYHNPGCKSWGELSQSPVGSATYIELVKDIEGSPTELDQFFNHITSYTTPYVDNKRTDLQADLQVLQKYLGLYQTETDPDLKKAYLNKIAKSLEQFNTDSALSGGIKDGYLIAFSQFITAPLDASDSTTPPITLESLCKKVLSGDDTAYTALAAGLTKLGDDSSKGGALSNFIKEVLYEEFNIKSSD